MYFVARAQANGNWPPEPTELNLYLAVPVTLVLIASSFTCQMGVFAAERGDVFGLRRWYTITLVMGAFFVAGQGYEYYHLVHEGTTISSSVYGSVFYMTTGFHGLHVIGGLDRTDPGQQVHARPGHRRDRCFVLLALCRHRVDRAVCHDLFHPLISCTPQAAPDVQFRPDIPKGYR